ncbi:unnamed protein product [Diamesa serratosioi]
MVITGYSGTPDKNVEAIWIYDSNTKYIPKDLGLLFNLSAFGMYNSQLIEIKSEDFINMKNLVELYLYDNLLEEIPNGVFDNNLQLDTISFYENKIKFIGSSVFDGLPKLDFVELTTNICISHGYKGSSAIIQLKNDIKSQCKNPNELQPTTTPISTEAPTTPKVIELSHELTLNCEFKYEEFVVNIFYSCEVTTLNINNNNTIITGHSGVHSFHKYDTDVKAIHIHDTNTKFIPENLGLVFSLSSLVIEKTQLIEIKTKDFIGMRNLEELNLSQNKLTSVPIGVFSTLTRLKSLNLGENEIEEIPNGVFANNLQLNDISLYMNKIKFLGSSLFQGLLKLNRVELNYNICIDKTYEGSHGIFELKNDIRTQCKIPNEITKITTQNPAATDLLRRGKRILWNNQGNTKGRTERRRQLRSQK